MQSNSRHTVIRTCTLPMQTDNILLWWYVHTHSIYLYILKVWNQLELTPLPVTVVNIAALSDGLIAKFLYYILLLGFPLFCPLLCSSPIVKLMQSFHLFCQVSCLKRKDHRVGNIALFVCFFSKYNDNNYVTFIKDSVIWFGLSWMHD